MGLKPLAVTQRWPFLMLLPVNQVHWLTSGIKVSHTPLCSLVCSILCRQNKIHILQAMNAAEAWHRGYESVCFLAWYNFLHRCASLDKARAKRRYRLTLAANFTPGMGACKGRVQPFKHLHHVTAHPQFLVLELQAPMGTCPGQYDICIMVHRCIKEVSHRVQLSMYTKLAGTSMFRGVQQGFYGNCGFIKTFLIQVPHRRLLHLYRLYLSVYSLFLFLWKYCTQGTNPIHLWGPVSFPGQGLVLRLLEAYGTTTTCSWVHPIVQPRVRPLSGTQSHNECC